MNHRIDNILDGMPPIGHNQPPAHEAIAGNIADLELEARNWLDGSKIENAAQASAVAALISEARKLGTEADGKRKEEATPFDAGKAEVQARWKPLIDKADRIAKVAKQAQGVWLVELDRQQRQKAAQAAAETEQLRKEAQAAYAAANPMNLAEREHADELLKAADKAASAATRAENATPTAKGGDGRAIGLRTYRTPTVTDLWQAAAHYFRTRPDDFTAWVLEQAGKDIRAGVTDIPGITIIEERKAA